MIIKFNKKSLKLICIHIKRILNIFRKQKLIVVEDLKIRGLISRFKVPELYKNNIIELIPRKSLIFFGKRNILNLLEK